jgi:hypothetical protein
MLPALKEIVEFDDLKLKPRRITRLLMESATNQTRTEDRIEKFSLLDLATPTRPNLTGSASFTVAHDLQFPR